jgi:hypothetical protein
MSRENSKSILPGTVSIDGTVRTSVAPPEHGPTWAEVIASLLAHVERETLAPEERAWLDALVTVQAAHTLGLTAGHETVLTEWTRCANALVLALVAGRLIGYGTLRFRFACELAAEIVRLADAQSSDASEAVGVRAQVRSALTDTRTLRREARRVLGNLAGRHADRRARIPKTREKRERVDTRSQSLRALATELKRTLKTVPARIAQEAGATPEFVRALNAAARGVTHADQSRQRQNQKVQQAYPVLHVLKGRLLHELRAMLGSARDARVSDPTVPTARTAIFKKSVAAKPATVKAPVVKAPVVNPPAPVVEPQSPDARKPA